MKLTLVSTTNKQSFEVAWLEVNSSAGNFVMQRGHAPMILLLTSHQPINYWAVFYTSRVKKQP